MDTLLKIKNLQLGYGNEEMLRIDELNLTHNSVTALLGPSGTGKSSLINAILRESPSLSYWEKGKFYLEGELLDKSLSEKQIGHVLQKARLFTGTVLENFTDDLEFLKLESDTAQKNFACEVFQRLGIWELFEDILDKPAIKQSMGIHKMLLIAKAIASKPKLLLLDEVLANTSLKDEEIIIGVIKKLKKITTVLLITHNKEEAKEISDSIALVSGGILHEHTETNQFFKQPQTELGKEFLQSGSAWYSNPLSDIVKKENQLSILRRFSSICEFYWILPNQLGGMQKPGLMTELDDDLKIMQQLGVNCLVSLQQKPIDPHELGKFQIEGVHFPIKDMGVPEIDKTFEFLSLMQKYFDEGKSVIYHCKAGMGRTGIMLACNLIFLNKISAIKAIEKIRSINHKYIQTDEQIEFVGEFELYLKSRV